MAALTQPSRHHDTAWDARLDRLREKRLLPWVEVAVAWVVAILCLLYYAYSYVRLRWTTIIVDDARFFPLVTQPKGVQKTQSTKDLYSKVLSMIAGASSDEALVELVRGNVELRRLLSVVFAQPDVTAVVPDIDRWRRLWPRFLALPKLEIDPTDCFPPENQQDPRIALILPAYREDGRRIRRILRVALENCETAACLQIVVVNAGMCSHMEAVTDFLRPLPASRVVDYTEGGGRGPTLHFGTQFVSEHVTWLTFLHSDTLLPKNWDTTVKQAWFTAKKNRKLQATAFLFGQDKSPEGLHGGPYPWGIEAVQMLGNVRAYALSLPYGDHVLSMPLAYYRYIGGFPAQPIMEDYELSDYLRRRARVLPHEYTTILPSMVRTGVRRWQMYGVVYVTLVNALIVYRYDKGWTPQDVFWYYYHRPKQAAAESVKED